MKKVFTGTMTVVALLWLSAFTSACDDDEKGNPQDQIRRTWVVGTSGFVKKGGVSITSEYPNLSVTLNADGTYSTTNAKKLFFPSGTWSWVGTGTTGLMIDGDLPVNVVELTKSTLRIQFIMDEAHVNANGRVNAVVGSYELSLEAQ